MQNQTVLKTEAPEGDEIDLLGMLGTLIDNKWLIIGATVTSMAASLAYGLLSTPVYKANALVQVEKKSSGLTGLDDLGAALGRESKSVTEIELIKSRTVVGKAVDELHLDLIVSPRYFPLIGKTIARRFTPTTEKPLNEAWLGLESYAWGGEALLLEQFEVPANLLNRTLLLRLTAKDEFVVLDDDENELLRGKVGQTLSQDGFSVLVKEFKARLGTGFAVVKAPRLETILGYQKMLEVSERGKDSGILNLALDGISPQKITTILNEISQQFVRQNIERNSAEAANSLVFLREQLPKVKEDLDRASNELNAYKKKYASLDVTVETQGVLQQSITLDAQLTDLKMQQAELDRRYTKQHPTYKALLQKIGELSQKREQLAGNIRNLPESQQQILRLTRDVQVGTEIYSRMLNKIQELDVVRAGTIGNARIIDEAAVDTRAPVAPKKALILAVGTLLGALLSSAFVLARRALNRGVENPEDIEKLGLPVYATVPLSETQRDYEEAIKRLRKRGENASDHVPLLSEAHPHDLAVEALRSLRTSLHFAMLEATNNRIMISGPSPGIGKSFVSANLAAIIAQSGQKVLLVDADMRKGHLHRMFGTGVENQGLSGLLARDFSFEQAVHTTNVPGLSFIPRGQIPPNPSELLLHPNFSAFLDEASKRFDLVIVDTPPLLAVTDAAIVGRLVGTSLIVTRFGVNPAREIDITVRRFAQNGIAIKGAIFNGLEKRASAYGRYGYGGYGYYQYEYHSGTNSKS